MLGKLARALKGDSGDEEQRPFGSGSAWSGLAHLSMGSRHDRLVLDLLLHDGEYSDRWMTCAGPRL